MRMAVITGEYPPDPGGIADYTALLVRAVTDQGHTAEVVLPATSTQPSLAPGVRSWHVRGWTLRDAGPSAKTVRETRPDAIVLQYVPQLYGSAGCAPGLVALMRRIAAERGRGPTVAILHELYSPWGRSPREWAISLIHRVQLRRLLRAVDTAVVTNPRYLQTLRDLAPAMPTHMIPVGATVAPAPNRHRHGEHVWPDGSSLLLGDFSFASVSKRPGLLLDALRAVGDRGSLLCIGGLPVDAKAMRAFERRVLEAGMADRVRVEPFLRADAVSSLMSTIDIYLHTAETGASTRSTSLASALAHGLPVVAFRGAETPTFYEEAMVLVTPGDDLGFCEAVARLSRDRRARNHLGQAGRSAFAANQSWPVIAARLLAVLKVG
jgi:glycosyltransferase involved in cell wall biosynthesis